MAFTFISSFIITIYVYFFITENKKFNNQKVLSIFLIFGFLILCAKNISRIINKFDQNYYNAPWPAIYSLNENDNNNLKKFEKVFDEKNNFLFFSVMVLNVCTQNHPVQTILMKT